MTDERANSGVPPLTDAEINAIACRLRQGQFLDDHYRERLFREPKEAELAYAGKGSKGEILAETMAVPLQALKRFGDNGEEWTNKLVFGDNLQVLKTLLEMKERGELRNADGSPGFRLCYIDPPFATLREFGGKKGQQAYRDKIEGAQFIEFLRKRLVFIRELLADDGTLFVHLDPKKGHYIKVVLDEIFSGHFRNEIIWWYWNKLQGNINRFPSNHDCIYVYSRTDKPYFQELMEERDDVQRLIKRVWDGKKKKLVNAKGPGGKVIYYEKDDRRIDDVWRLSMLQPADKTEVVDYPTQKPEALLDLVMESSTKEGDLVLDCFVGSGTTAVVAERRGRRWIAVDSGKLAIYTSQRRLLELTEGRGRNKAMESVEPFELCTAGLYENQLLEKLPYTDYERFCLELFGCRAEAHEIAGIPMAGTRKGGLVHFFPFMRIDAVMGRRYIEDLHDRLKSKVSGAVYVVVPVSACDPGLFEDVIRLDENVYFVLRVPYSVIEALHGRDFKVPPQPSSLAEVNDALDSFGFDFVQPPEVEVSYRRTQKALKVSVTSFARGGLDPDDFSELPDQGRGDLAMVMIDSSYDGQVFRLTDHLFGAELAESEWQFAIERKRGDKEVMLSFMDTHGNERREIVSFAPKRARSSKKVTAKTSRAKKKPAARRVKARA
jgi:DNA modification methylase